MDQGLAQSMAPQQGMDGDRQAMVQQVVAMLMEGMDPEELLQQGVPMDVIEEAISILLAQEQGMSNAQAAPATEAGLAMTMGM